MFKRAMLLALAAGILCASSWAITPNQHVRSKRVALYVLPGHQIPSNNLSGGGKTLLIGVIIGIILAIILAKAL